MSSVAAALCVLVGRDELLDRVRGDQRMVAGEDHDGLARLDVLASGEDGGAGALAGRLRRGDYALGKSVLDALAGPNDDDDRAQRRHPGQQRSSNGASAVRRPGEEPSESATASEFHGRPP